MFSAARITQPSPANTRFHLRLQVRVSRLGVPYLHPVVTLTTRGGARL